MCIKSHFNRYLYIGLKKYANKCDRQIDISFYSYYLQKKAIAQVSDRFLDHL